jgi:hypothetical protein
MMYDFIVITKYGYETFQYLCALKTCNTKV